MAILYFYCDESGKYKKNPVVSLTGVAATKDHIEKFDNEWETLLRSYGLFEFHMSHIADLNQACGRKMSRGQTADERIKTLLPFVDCINQHLEIGLAQAWDVKGYAHLTLEAKSMLGGSNDLYFLANVRGFQEIVDYATDGNEGARVSVIADDDLTSAWDLYLHYRSIRDAVPKIRKALVGLTFANSAYFPALQAADLVAFLTRTQAQQNFYGKKNDWDKLFHYATTEGNGTIRWFQLFIDEKKMYELAQEMNALAEAKKK